MGFPLIFTLYIFDIHNVIYLVNNRWMLVMHRRRPIPSRLRSHLSPTDWHAPPHLLQKCRKSHKTSQIQNQANLEHRRFAENCQWQFDSTTVVTITTIPDRLWRWKRFAKRFCAVRNAGWKDRGSKTAPRRFPGGRFRTGDFLLEALKLILPAVKFFESGILELYH